jgi:hypothetical protein
LTSSLFSLVTRKLDTLVIEHLAVIYMSLK